MRISILATNYNHERYIETAVKSILEQTFSDFELIIIDDGSTDGSHDKIRELAKLDDRIVTILNKENKGKWSVLNQAARQAKGRYITLQDADDASAPQRLEFQLKALESMKSYHNLCGFVHCYTDQDVLNYKTQTLAMSPEVMDHQTVLAHVYQGFRTKGINHYYIGPDYEAHGATCLFPKQLWDHGMKFLPGNMGLRCQRAEDSDFNTKMTLLLQRTSIVRAPLYYYRRNSSTNNAWLEEL